MVMFSSKISCHSVLFQPALKRIFQKFNYLQRFEDKFVSRTIIIHKRMESSSKLHPSLSQEVIDEVVNSWVDITRIPTISGGHLTEDKNFLKISTNWSVSDFAKKENVAFQRQFSVLKSSLNWPDGQDVLTADQILMTASEAVPIDGKKICISPCGTRKAILVEKGDKSSGQKTQILEIWSEHTLLKSYDLGELDKHKNVYTSGFFGTTMVWDKAAKKLAYLAEKKAAKAKPFFNSNVKKDEEKGKDFDEKKKDEKDIKGEEYALRQTWGEQLQDMYFSVIVVLDIDQDKFELIELSENDAEFPIDIQWVGNTSIIGTSYEIPPWRLGLYACNNRRSRIFQVDVDGKNLKFLSPDGKAAFSPRVRPNGEYVIWQERAVDEPHNRSRDIIGMSLKESKAPEVIYNSSSVELPVYADFPRSCWTPDGSSFLMITIKDGETALFALSLTNDGTKIRTIIDKSPGIRGLLWIGNEFLLVSRSSTLSTPYVELIQLSGDNKRAQITKSSPSVHNGDQFEIKKVYGKATVPSFYIGPKNSGNKQVPLIVMPHGGPHAVTVDAFVDELAVLLQQGFAVLKVNYIGSLGSKKDETDELLGKIGKLDVEDCHEIVQQVLKSTPCIDSEQIGLFGGSHGGFLSAHLSGQYPDFYKAAILLNPVCDLNVMIGTSDIVDWCMAESGIAFPDNTMKTFIPAAKNVDDFRKLYEASPIVHVSKVKAATLLLLGTEDLRVPITQGMNFYRALKAYNKTAEVRVYPDCHSLLSPSVANDVAIQSVLWFKRFLKK